MVKMVTHKPRGKFVQQEDVKPPETWDEQDRQDEASDKPSRAFPENGGVLQQFCELVGVTTCLANYFKREWVDKGGGQWVQVDGWLPWQKIAFDYTRSREECERRVKFFRDFDVVYCWIAVGEKLSWPQMQARLKEAQDGHGKRQSAG